MNVFTALMLHESNRFSPIPTDRASFQSFKAENAGLQREMTNIGDGDIYEEFVKIFLEAGHSVTAGPAFGAQPSAPTNRSDYESLRDEILEKLADSPEVDCVALFLHGAQMAEGYEDCEGDLLEKVRHIVGPEKPVGVLLDLHGNVSDKMLEMADLLIAGREYPHIDYPERARELCALLERTLKKEVSPVITKHPIPALGMFRTTVEPLRGFVDSIQALETGSVLSISLMHGFAWSDTPDTRGNVLVLTDSESSEGTALARSVAEKCLSIFVRTGSGFLVTVEQALEQARTAGDGLVVIADVADNPGGGAPSDSTFILEAMLDQGVKNAAIGMIWDPVAVQLAVKAGTGSRLALRIGGKISPFSGSPLDVMAEILATGEFPVEGEGVSSDIRAAVRVDDVTIVLNSVRDQVYSPKVFSQMGINLDELTLVVVKSSQHFHHAFNPIASHIIYCDTPGSLSSDLHRFPFTNLPRPIWPLDEIRDSPAGTVMGSCNS
jgi:microcystin degradation protein MlrC